VFPSDWEINSAWKPLLRNSHFKGRYDNTAFALWTRGHLLFDKGSSSAWDT